MTKRIPVRRFKVNYDDATGIRCCCSIEEHAVGEYVRYSDYVELFEQAEQYKEIAQGYNRDLNAVENHLCRFPGCDLPAVMEDRGKGFCYDHLPAQAKGTYNES